MKKGRVIIAGGTGLIGRHLLPLLQVNGFETAVLTRNPDGAPGGAYYWDPGKGEIDERAMEGARAVIHLAGASVGEGRWTARRKEEILESRIQTTRILFSALEKAKEKPGVFLAASATGYYGDRGEQELTEESPPGEGFLSETVRAWEKETAQAARFGLRTVLLRTGVVLAKEGGALPKMAGPVKFGVGSALGSGRQYVPWIHIEDICGIYLHALLQDRMQGIYNAVAPEALDNARLTRALGRALHRPVFFPPVPGFVLKLLLGEMSHLVLDSTRVLPGKLEENGYVFRFPEIAPALEDLYGS